MLRTMHSQHAHSPGATERIHVRRAQRYTMKVPLRFRLEGREEWRDAVIQNISGSGILFSASECSNITDRLEFMFMLPGSGAAQVTCIGRVARVVRPPKSGPRCEIAASIDSYYFERASADRLSAP
jgi:PilZ domain